MTKTKQAVWVDFLCWESAFKIIQCSKSAPIEKIHFINAASSFRRFIPWLERTAGAPCFCADDIAEAEFKWQGMSLYETIQTRITGLLNIWMNQKNAKSFSEKFCEFHGYNIDKFEAHLQEAAYSHVYRAVEISVLAESLYGEHCIVILRRTPFKRLFKHFLGVKQLSFYRTFFSHRLNIDNRNGYYYDNHLNPNYFKDRFSTLGHFVSIWLFNSISALFNMRGLPKLTPPETVIGIELTQSRQRPDAIHDLAWFQNSGIQAKHVHAFEFTNYDEESIEFINSFGIQRHKVLQFPSQLLKRLGSISHDPDVTSLTAQRSFGLKTFLTVAMLARCVFIWNESSWLRFQSAKYLTRTLFWRSIYESLGVRMLWTMFDVDEDKLAKSQAIELLGGLYTGGHWSNFPMYHVDNQKCLDVIMAWGEHFIKNNLQRSAFMAIFLVGYPCDYYFKMHQESARAIRERHEGKFILSYHDNIMANDLPYSKGMQLEIHQMLLSILKKFENVIILLKPKRRFVLDEIFALLPELAFYLREGRLEVFLGDTPRTKAVPAEIGMASDLVIGLGISTAATEAYLAGAVAFHADFTGFERNEFGNRAEGVVVFRDIFTLENAVIDRIKGKNKWSYEDYRGYYTGLDPFQDGSAAKRIGFILKRIREYLVQGVDRYVLLEKVKNDYDVYLSSMKSLQGMSFN